MINSKSSRLKGIGLIALLAVMLVIPLVSSSFLITMFIRYMYYGLLTISFAFLASQLGLFSLMVPVSLTICGYIVGLGVLRWNMNVWLAVLLGILGSQAFAAVCGVMVNRSKGTSFLMLTLVISQLVWSLSLQWTTVTNGSSGHPLPELSQYLQRAAEYQSVLLDVHRVYHLRGIRVSADPLQLWPAAAGCA